MLLIAPSLGIVCVSGGNQAVYSTSPGRYDACPEQSQRDGQVATSIRLADETLTSVPRTRDEGIAKGYFFDLIHHDVVAGDMPLTARFDNELIDSHGVASL